MATTLLRPDQSFYPSPRLASKAPMETLAYMVTFDPTAKTPDALVTLDVNPKSKNYGKQAGRVEAPHKGDELHHFGWNVCSALPLPIRSASASRAAISDRSRPPLIAHPRLRHEAGSPKAEIVQTIEPNEIADAPATAARTPFIAAPMESIQRAWLAKTVMDRAVSSSSTTTPLTVVGTLGARPRPHSFWPTISGGTSVTTRRLPASGARRTWSRTASTLNPADRRIWPRGPHMGPSQRRHRQEIDLGAEHQMALELRPAHDPTKAYGFVGVVVPLQDLSASIWPGNSRQRQLRSRKSSKFPPSPPTPTDLPPLLKGFKAVPPLVTDINLSLDDRFLYVSCWGTGEFLQFDVCDPFHPKLTGSRPLGRDRSDGAYPNSPKTDP